MRRFYNRLVCALVGCKPETRAWRPFSYRHKICMRCHRFPKGMDLTKALS